MENSSLKIVEFGLVNVYESEYENEKLVDAKELHEFLKVDTPFHKWIARKVEKYGFEAGVDFWTILSESNGGRPATDYKLTLDTAKEVAMLENNDNGRLIRKYFIDVEKKYRNALATMSIEDLIISQAQRLKEIRLEQERMKQLQVQTNNKVEKIEGYLSEVPTREKVNRKIKELARTHYVKNVAKATNEMYRVIKGKYGMDVMQLVENKRNKIQEDRVAEGKEPYADNTLKTKVNGIDILEEKKMLSEAMEILIGLISRDEN